MQEFIKEFMKNSVSRYLAVYIKEAPSLVDLRRFEDALGTDLTGVTAEDYEEWHTGILCRNNYMIYRIYIEDGLYKAQYITELEGEEMEDYAFGKDITVYTFEELWNCYMPTEDELNIVDDSSLNINHLDIISQKEMDKMLDAAEQVVMDISNKYSKPSEQYPTENSKLIEWLEENRMTELEITLQNTVDELKEEIDLLQDTIKEMEEQIKTLHTIILYLENKVGI